MNNRKRSGSVFLISGLILLAAALLLTGYNLWDNHRAANSASGALNALHGKMTQSDGANADKVPDYVLYPDMSMPTIEIDNRQYVGILRIPSVSISVPVLSQWSDEELKIAPCRYAGSVYQNNMVIAAHNYSSHFGRLGRVSMGDEVTFMDAAGNVFRYKVADIEVLQPNDTADMVSGEWALTLFTCTWGGQSRVTLRCELQKN